MGARLALLLAAWVSGWARISDYSRFFSTWRTIDHQDVHSGDVALLVAEDVRAWSLERVLTGSHSDVVRCVLWDHEVLLLSFSKMDSLKDVFLWVTELCYPHGR